MSTEPSVPDGVWRDPAFQRLPQREQLARLRLMDDHCAFCGRSGKPSGFKRDDQGRTVCRNATACIRRWVGP